MDYDPLHFETKLQGSLSPSKELNESGILTLQTNAYNIIKHKP